MIHKAGQSLANTVKIFFLLLLAAIIISCGSKASHYGAEATLASPPISPSEALLPKNFERKVRLSGKICSVCGNEGCWIGVSDDKRSIGVMFEKSLFTAPLDCKGKLVELEGRLTERVITSSDAIKFDLEAGENHEFCLLGENNCGQKKHGDNKRAGIETDSRVPIFIATSMTIIE